MIPKTFRIFFLGALTLQSFSPFLLQSAIAQEVPAQYSPWKYIANYSSYFSAPGFYDSPEAAYGALIDVTKTSYCYFTSTPLSDFTIDPYHPDTYKYATFTTTLSAISPSDPMCGRYAIETPKGYVIGTRTVSCPPLDEVQISVDREHMHLYAITDPLSIHNYGAADHSILK